jgi:membrane-bound lytic murein transglycosylase A
VRSAGAAILVGVVTAGIAVAEPLREAPGPDAVRLPPDTVVAPREFGTIDGWARDDHAAAFRAFLTTCAPILDGTAMLRDAVVPSPALRLACIAARALAVTGVPDREQARGFFETHFAPVEIRPAGGDGFLTAYFEPEIEASLERSPDFSVPVLARPPDLVTLKQGEVIAGLPAGLQAARRRAEGLVPFPDRAAIWAGALAGQGLEIAWVRDEAELFVVQVQGSARLVLPDGSRTRLTYAGRNGHAYTSIGRKLVERGDIPLAEMSLERLTDWLRADPARGRALMEENRSYIFFARDDSGPPDQGPIGGAGVPLAPHRSLAIDRTIWPYGLPVFIDMAPLAPGGGRERIARLMIAQDTGSAILGPARGDYFMGSGREAGTRAGLVRDPARFIVLLPRDPAP